MKDSLWSHSYSIGVEYLNRQHMHLLKLVADVESAIENKAPAASLESHLRDFIEYCEEHFADEEELQQKIPMPEDMRQTHKEQHELIYTNIFALDEKLHKAPESARSELTAFLKEWIVDHILVQDKAFAPFAKDFADYKPSRAARRKMKGRGKS